MLPYLRGGVVPRERDLERLGRVGHVCVEDEAAAGLRNEGEVGAPGCDRSFSRWTQFQAGQRAHLQAVGGGGRVGVPGYEWLSTCWTHFQAGQRRTWGASGGGGPGCEGPSSQ